jgi:hypothetical protein
MTPPPMPVMYLEVTGDGMPWPDDLVELAQLARSSREKMTQKSFMAVEFTH